MPPLPPFLDHVAWMDMIYGIRLTSVKIGPPLTHPLGFNARLNSRPLLLDYPKRCHLEQRHPRDTLDWARLLVQPRHGQSHRFMDNIMDHQ